MDISASRVVLNLRSIPKSPCNMCLVSPVCKELYGCPKWRRFSRELLRSGKMKVK